MQTLFTFFFKKSQLQQKNAGVPFNDICDKLAGRLSLFSWWTGSEVRWAQWRQIYIWDLESKEELELHFIQHLNVEYFSNLQL